MVAVVPPITSEFALAPDALVGIEHRPIEFETGDTIVAEGDGSDEVILIISGIANVSAGDSNHLLAQLGPGDVIGEVSALAGGARTATVAAASALHANVLSRQGFADLLERDPQLAASMTTQATARLDRRHMLASLERLFGHLDLEVIADFEESMEWVNIESGEVLFERGDANDGGYFLISGRLQKWAPDVDGDLTLVSEVASDGIVGETGLFRRENRTTTVIAVRDSRLVKVGIDDFLRLATKHPQALIPIIAGLAGAPDESPHDNRRRTLALCVAADVDSRVFGSRLASDISKWGSTAHLWPAKVDAVLGRQDLSQSKKGEPGDLRIVQLIHQYELDHTYLVCEADRNPSNWSNRVARQADYAVAVINPSPSDADRHTVSAFFEAASQQAKRVIVVVHPRGTTQPADTLATTRDWAPHTISHIRTDSSSDFERLVRIITGNAKSLVLGGGGARGFAHLGVYRALCELGIPTDLVGGSSIGAPLAGGIAMDKTPTEYTDIVEERFSGILDYTIPIVSLVKGERITQSIEKTFSGWEFEDCWRPLFCVSTNLTQATEMVHDSGDIVRAVRASVAIPGVIPPIAFGEDLLVDGGVLNNLPGDVMRRRNPTGTVIAVDVAPPKGPRSKGDTGMSVSGWQAMRAKASRKRNEYPGITAVMLRTMITGAARQRRRSVDHGDIDLYLDLDLRGVSLLAFETVREVAGAGYEAAMPRLEAWLESEADR